jgi:hypothetical protein
MFKVARSRFDWVLTGYSWASEYWTKIKIEMVNDRSWKLHEFFYHRILFLLTTYLSIMFCVRIIIRLITLKIKSMRIIYDFVAWI